MIKKKFKTPLYGIEFTAIIYRDKEELKNMFSGSEFNPNRCEYDGCVFTHKKHLYIVFLAADKGYPTPGIIAHEAKHLVNNIFIEIHHELDRYNDEPEAYLLGWIVNRIHELKNNL